MVAAVDITAKLSGRWLAQREPPPHNPPHNPTAINKLEHSSGFISRIAR